MGQVIPFITRISASHDWTAEERARLAELGERLIAAGLKVEVIYGATEEGDPWCVVKDEHEEVLIHVARIGGAFVIHHALDDSLREGDDLPAILAERLAWEETSEGVTPFSRQAQSLLVLIVATAFFYESARHEDGPQPIAGREPIGDPAVHAAASGADLGPHAHLADDALAASKALHAEAMTQAAGVPAIGPALTGSAPEWRSFAVEDEDIGRADHGGGELALARAATGAAPAIANLEVAAPAAAASLAAAFGGPFASHAPPLAAPVQAPASQPPATFVASFRPTAPDHPDARTPAPEDHPAVVAARWVDLDLDGDGRPDVRVAVPDEVKPSSREPEPAHVAATDHDAVALVGHGFQHVLIA